MIICIESTELPYSNGHRAGKVRKELRQLITGNVLSLEVEFNLKAVNYLHIALDLNTGT